jgi:phage/plasmid-associated DNA primase
LDEFSIDAQINTSRIKTLVGGGLTTTRDLFKSQVSFRNTCNVVCFNNFSYQIPTRDHGTWRRIYHYTCKIKFTDNPDPNNKYEKKGNADIEKKYPYDDNYRRAMLSIMVHYWTILETRFGGNLNKIPVPTIVRETEIFRNSQDTINRFITSMVVLSPNSEEISLDKVCILYTEWYLKSMGKKPTGTIDSIRAEFMNSRLEKLITRLNDISSVVRGCRIKVSIDEPTQLGETTI